jgi:hypothetical protein
MFWLVVAREDFRIDLNALAKAQGRTRFSFGKPERLVDVLGVGPGSTTPFALMNDKGGLVTAVFDQGMLAKDPVNLVVTHMRHYRQFSPLGWFNELALVMIASAAVFVWNLAVFYLLYQFLSVPIMIAKMIGTLVGFVLNYTARQFWIFSRLSRYASTSTMFDKRTAQDRNP